MTESRAAAPTALLHASAANLGRQMNRQQRRAAARRGKRVIEAAPSAARQVLAAAFQHHQGGRLEDAERLCREALAIAPRDAEGLHLLGVLAYQTGRPGPAINMITRAIAINRNEPTYHSNLGLALAQLGRLDEAVARYRTAIALKRDYPEANNNLGVVLQAQGRLEEAVACYRAALGLRPDYPEAHNNLGIVLKETGRLDEAIGHYRAALELRPDYPEAHNNLGIALAEQCRFTEAVTHYQRALARKPDFANAHNNLANALRNLDELDDAITHYERALAIMPDCAGVYSNLGKALLNQGRLEQARQAYEKAIALEPGTARHYRSLLDVRRIAAGDPHLARMEKLAETVTSLPIVDQTELHFALGRAYADLEQHELAFRHLLRGNALRRQEIHYDEPATLGLFDRIRAVFTPELIRNKQGLGDPSARPIFIVGMPRSGTTLVEQILASHTEVFAAGEREDFAHAADNLHVPGDASLCFPEIVATLPGEILHRFGTNYLGAIAAKAPASGRITDKMPGNFAYAGLIHLALPNARIIHLRRDPIDTCLSCFSVLFTIGQPHSYDLAELGRYYRAYETLMEHWRQVLPAGVILDVRYEDVVADVEREAHRIVAHCRLDWDDACRAFHQTRRTVRTASAAQVRQDIYRTSIGRWRPYEKFLQPLIQALNAAGSCGGIA
jgi:tetratricopeptide (TPR) repeat protein